ncbi:MAG: hypothetical protein HC801_13730 [Nitrospira sp.]|nr:hypothetical protein [Nitrospira sp.]
MNIGTRRAFDTRGLIFFYTDDTLEIVSTGDGTRELRKLDLHTLRRLEIEVIVHGVRNRIPCDGDASVAGFGLDILRRRWQFLRFRYRIPATPFILNPFNTQTKPIDIPHLIN